MELFIPRAKDRTLVGYTCEQKISAGMYEHGDKGNRTACDVLRIYLLLISPAAQSQLTVPAILLLWLELQQPVRALTSGV